MEKEHIGIGIATFTSSMYFRTSNAVEILTRWGESLFDDTKVQNRRKRDKQSTEVT